MLVIKLLMVAIDLNSK